MGFIKFILVLLLCVPMGALAVILSVHLSSVIDDYRRSSEETRENKARSQGGVNYDRRREEWRRKYRSRNRDGSAGQ